VQQNPVEAFRDVGVDLPEISDPVCANDVEILLFKIRCDRLPLSLQVLGRNIPFPHQEHKNIAQAEEVMTEDVLVESIVIIKVNPAMYAALLINDDMVSSYVPMLLSVGMKKTDGTDTFFEMIQEIGKLFVKIAVVIHLHIFHMGVQRFSFDKINDPDGIALFILGRESVHELPMVEDQVQNPGLFPRASKALEFNFPDVGSELLEEHELDNLEATVRKVDRPLYPKLLFTLKPESQFLGIVADKIRPPFKDKYVIIIHLEKIRGIRMHAEPPGDLRGRKPPGRHPVKGFLG